MSELNARAIEILEARGLDVEILVGLGVGSHPQRGGEWIAIPYLRRGEVVNHKYRTIEGEKRFYQDKDAAKCLWNEDAIFDPSLADHPLIVCEGEFDAAIALQCGFPRVVSVPDGAPKEALGEAEDGQSKYDFLTPEVIAALRSVSVIILATDGDGPGCNLREDLAIRLGRPRCKYLRYPPSTKDLNEVFLHAGGRDAVRGLIENAEWLRIEGMYRMSELPPLAEPTAYPLGHAAVDEMIRIRRGDFSVVTGIPNMGKSTWINEVACRLAHRHGWVTAFFSPEQRPQIDHRRALRHWFLGKPQSLWAWDEVARADDWIDQHFVFLVPDDEADQDATLDWVLDTAAASVIRQNVKMVVIDPWNEIEHAVSRDQTLTIYTGQAIKRFKRFARRFNVHQLVAAHPTKVMKDKRSGEWPVPTLYDISDSAHWYNKPDIGMVVHRVPDRTIIRVEKVRYHGINGQRGDLPVEFDRYQGRYRVREDLLEPAPDAQLEREVEQMAMAMEGM